MRVVRKVDRKVCWVWWLVEDFEACADGLAECDGVATGGVVVGVVAGAMCAVVVVVDVDGAGDVGVVCEDAWRLVEDDDVWIECAVVDEDAVADVVWGVDGDEVAEVLAGGFAVFEVDDCACEGEVFVVVA